MLRVKQIYVEYNIVTYKKHFDRRDNTYEVPLNIIYIYFSLQVYFTQNWTDIAKKRKIQKY